MAMQDTRTRFVDRLRELIGYVENGSDTLVTISLDDATKDIIVTVGRNKETRRRYHGSNLAETFEQAFQDPFNDPYAP